MNIEIPIHQLCHWELAAPHYYLATCATGAGIFIVEKLEDRYKFCPFCGKTLVVTEPNP